MMLAPVGTGRKVNRNEAGRDQALGGCKREKGRMTKREQTLDR